MNSLYHFASYPGRTGGWIRFWSELNRSNAASDRPYVSMEIYKNPWAGYQTSPSPAPTSPKPRVRKSMTTN